MSTRPLVIYVENDDPVVEQTLLEFVFYFRGLTYQRRCRLDDAQDGFQQGAILKAGSGGGKSIRA